MSAHGGEAMGRKMRMTLPKKEQDLEKVVEEVQSVEHEHHHHHHHHEEGLDELLHTIDVLLDTMNSRITDLEEKMELLRNEIKTIYKLLSLAVKGIVAESSTEKEKILNEMVSLLESGNKTKKTNN
jgi:hypothetical protein